MQFFQSIRTSISKGHSVLVAAMYSHITTDWRAAESILSRRFPEDWAKQDYMKVEGTVTEKPVNIKEIEEDIFKGIPTSKRKEVLKDMQKVIEGAREHKDKKIIQA